MKKVLLTLVLAGVFCFIATGCSWFSKNSSSTNESNVMPGSDRDAHGCIPSAGYSWCEAKQKCLRSWEEECK